MNDEVSRVYGYIRLLAKQSHSYFDNSLHCHDPLVRMQILGVLRLRHAIESLLSSSDQLGHQDLLKKCFPENWASTGHPDAHLAKSLGVNND